MLAVGGDNAVGVAICAAAVELFTAGQLLLRLPPVPPLAKLAADGLEGTSAAYVYGALVLTSDRGDIIINRLAAAAAIAAADCMVPPLPADKGRPCIPPAAGVIYAEVDGKL